MAVAYFSMADLQDVWENGGQNAYFAESYYGQRPGAGAAVPNKGIVIPTNFPAGAAADTPAPRPRGKRRGVVRVINKKGKTFFKSVELNAEKAYNAGKGAVAKGANMAGRGAGAVGGYAARGVEMAGRGAVNAGGFVRDRANQLGGAIARNPKIAGAAIIGGTAAGGAYAYSRRDK